MMTSRLSLLALVLSLGTALPALAQETAPAEGAPADGSTSSDLSMGVEVGSGETKVGDSYIAAKFESWEQRCVKTPTGADPCQLYMLLKDSEGSNVAELSIFNLPEGSEGPAVAGATFIAPLETLLTAGVQLVVDSGKPRAYPFTLCTQIGCVARIGFTAEEIAQFKKGSNAVLTIVPFVAPDEQVKVTASLKGFTAGYDAVAAANKVADAAAAAPAAATEAPAAPAAP
ncbi:invasion associated locus B family protein [Neotabrizicola sp. VNH66]|uniref:invasion associated locus B family protein n=1 Tax=Neotabrizicola sp. VNH66 TaxID=3400918 RepID=UPI003C01DD5D